MAENEKGLQIMEPSIDLKLSFSYPLANSALI